MFSYVILFLVFVEYIVQLVILLSDLHNPYMFKSFDTKKKAKIMLIPVLPLFYFSYLEYKELDDD